MERRTKVLHMREDKEIEPLEIITEQEYNALKQTEHANTKTKKEQRKIIKEVKNIQILEGLGYTLTYYRRGNKAFYEEKIIFYQPPPPFKTYK